MKKLLILIFVVFVTFLYSKQKIEIVNKSIFIDTKNLTFDDISKEKFKKINEKHLNFGFNNKISIWIKLDILNNTNIVKKSVLDLNNPLLEEVLLYYDGKISRTGMLNIDSSKKAINPYFILKIDKYSKETYFLKITNKTTALQFSINLFDENTFFYNDKKKQFFIIFFIGILVAFLIYALALYIFIKDKSYIYYVIYILFLLFQQLTYIGFLPLYTSKNFTYIDNLLVVPKVSLLIIAAIFFARSFLKTSKFKKIDNVYKFIITFLILQILTFSTQWFYYPEVTVLTGLVFIFFNLYAAVYVFIKGNKQARFFIVGWSFLIIGFFLSIIDALGIYSIMYHIPSLVLLLTILEALFLLLAFVDKLNILREQKKIANNKLLIELKRRNIIIENEVRNRTTMLNNLYRELHHRVKNNLQIMLSIIRLQGDKQKDKNLKEQFNKLENRIKSISKTHDILYLNENIENIDMYEYLYSLCEDIEMSYLHKNVEFFISCEVQISLKYAVYLGIIINEIVTNSMKHSKECTYIIISLKCIDKNKGLYEMNINDNGEGFIYKENPESLGLKLVNNLVKDQLKGSIEQNSIGKCEYNIRFNL